MSPELKLTSGSKVCTNTNMSQILSLYHAFIYQLHIGSKFIVGRSFHHILEATCAGVFGPM